MLAILRFDKSTKPRGRNRVISRTCHKIAVIDSKIVMPVMPQPGELWLCQINREIVSSDTRRGALIVRPNRRVHESELIPLSHGMYELTELTGRCLLAMPAKQGQLHMFSEAARRALIAAYAADSIILGLGGEMWEQTTSAADVLLESSARLAPSPSQVGE